jgi:hypothetical protein
MEAFNLSAHHSTSLKTAMPEDMDLVYAAGLQEQNVAANAEACKCHMHMLHGWHVHEAYGHDKLLSLQGLRSDQGLSGPCKPNQHIYKQPLVNSISQPPHIAP